MNGSSWIFIWQPHYNPSEDNTIIHLSGKLQKSDCCAQVCVFIIHNIWICILNLCQTAVYFRGGSCYWDSISVFFFSKCHRKKHCMLAQLHKLLTRINKLSENHIQNYISEAYSLPFQCFVFSPGKNVSKMTHYITSFFFHNLDFHT